MVKSNPEVTDIGMYVLKVWCLEWVAREVPVLHRYESAAEGWERIPEEEIVEKDFQIEPKSCLDSSLPREPGGL